MPRIPITLSDQDRARLEVLATAQDVSLSEAVRRAVLAEYERTQEASVQRKTEAAVGLMLERIAARVENAITLQRSAELDLKALLSGMSPLLESTSLRVLAMVNTMQRRDAVEGEIERLMRSSRDAKE